jgi:hypothetical protein
MDSVFHVRDRVGSCILCVATFLGLYAHAHVHTYAQEHKLHSNQITQSDNHESVARRASRPRSGLCDGGVSPGPVRCGMALPTAGMATKHGRERVSTLNHELSKA